MFLVSNWKGCTEVCSELGMQKLKGLIALSGNIGCGNGFACFLLFVSLQGLGTQLVWGSGCENRHFKHWVYVLISDWSKSNCFSLAIRRGFQCTKVDSVKVNCFVCKVDTPNSGNYFNWITIFECYMVRCGSKMDMNNTCIQKRLDFWLKIW